MVDWYQYNIYGFYFHYNILFHFLTGLVMVSIFRPIKIFNLLAGEGKFTGIWLDFKTKTCNI